MRVGFIVECFRDGADHKVLLNLLPRLRADVEPQFSFCGSKRVLFEECGRLVAGLLDVERCERVIVLWDLMPCDERFHDKGSPSCTLERAHLVSQLRPQDHERTIMLCVTHELEAWLLADGRAVTAVLERPTHKIRPIADERRPEAYPNPKARLRTLFRQHGRGDYNDAVHAVKIVENVANLTKLDRAPSFSRLRAKLAAL